MTHPPPFPARPGLAWSASLEWWIWGPWSVLPRKVKGRGLSCLDPVHISVWRKIIGLSLTSSSISTCSTNTDLWFFPEFVIFPGQSKNLTSKYCYKFAVICRNVLFVFCFILVTAIIPTVPILLCFWLFTKREFRDERIACQNDKWKRFKPDVHTQPQKRAWN